jgi:hypothetical protein
MQGAAPPPSLVQLKDPTLSAACLFTSLFIIQFFFLLLLLQGRNQSIPGVVVGMLHAAYLLTCWSASPKQVWSWHLAAQEPFCFLNAT